MRDLQALVRTTYELLEGDRLELLLVHQRVEALRTLSHHAIKAGDAVLPNVDGVLRASTPIVPGLKIIKFFEGYGNCVASVRRSISKVNSSLYVGQERIAYEVVYEVDRVVEELEEGEIRPLIIVKDRPERAQTVEVLNIAFDYLEDRITGTCRESQYSCAHMYSVCKMVQLFNPVFATQSMTPDVVDEMFHTVRPLAVHVNLERLKAEIPAYLSAAMNIDMIDVSDVAVFAECI